MAAISALALLSSAADMPEVMIAPDDCNRTWPVLFLFLRDSIMLAASSVSSKRLLQLKRGTPGLCSIGEEPAL